MRLEIFERRAIQFNERFLDNGFHLTVTFLHIHHHRDRHTTGEPLGCRLGEVTHERHVTRLAGCDEVGSVHTDGIAVIGIEIRRHCATSFISEEMVEGCELTFVLAVGFEDSQTFLNHLDEQFLGLYLRNHHVSVRVAVERELLGDTFRQRAEELAGSRGQFGLHVLTFGIVAVEGNELLVGSKHVVEFLNEDAHGGDELDEAFRDKDGTEIKACVRTGYNDLDDIFHDVVKGHLLGLHLLGDKADIRLALECALEGNMGSGTPHETNEMPVFLGGVGITLDVTDKLGIGLASGVETERGLDHLVLEVAVDSLRTADDLDTALLLEVVLGEHTGVGITIITTNNNDSLDTQLFAYLDTIVELPCLFQFGTSGTDDIETAGITVLINDVARQFLILSVNQSGRTAEEAVEFVIRIEGFETVIKAGDDIVSTGSLTSGKDNTYVKRLGASVLVLRRFHSNNRQAISVREEFFNLFLVCYGLCFLAFYEAYAALQCYRHFRLISLTGDL